VRIIEADVTVTSTYLALRHALLSGRMLRSGDRPGLEQLARHRTVVDHQRLRRSAQLTGARGTSPAARIRQA
jgi:hypothetical protein